MDRPFTPDTLAERWDCSATTIRTKCNAGELPHFRLGKLYRIPAKIVAEIEVCAEYVDASAAKNELPHARTEAIVITHAPERRGRSRNDR